MKDLAAINRRISSRIPEGQAGLGLLDATVTGPKAKDLETKLHRLVIGQEEAIQEIVRTYQTYLAGLSPNGRPIATFLFLGPIDVRYGARPLKRAIERLLVQPLSNLMATGQIQCHDRIRITHSHESPSLTFFRETDVWETWETNGVAAA